MSKEYLPDKEKRILLSAISREERVIKDNNLTELIPVVKNLDYKFMYDRLFKQIEDNAYQQGIADERERIIKELEEKYNEHQKQWGKYRDSHDFKGMSDYKDAIEIVRGEQNEKNI